MDAIEQHIFSTHRRVLIALVVFLTACGGGGGGGSQAPAPTSFGNSLPPSTGPGDSENFFPNATGSSWTYSAVTTVTAQGVTLPDVRYLDSVSVSGTKSVNGQIATVFLDEWANGPPREGYYFKNAGGLAFLGTNDAADTVTNAFTPAVLGLFPIAPEVVASFDKSGIDFGSDLDGDGTNETLSGTMTNTVHGFEPLTLGIGSFARTVKASESITASIVLSASKTSIPFRSTATHWAAPGVGILKTVSEATVGTTTAVEVMNARGYVVDGVAHGFGMPFTIATDLAPGGWDIDNPGPPAVATDGQNFLAATATVSGGIRAVLFNPAGSVITTVILSPGAKPAVAFDGSNYWVVFTSRPLGPGPGCWAQRISAAGVLLDPLPITLTTDAQANSELGFAFGTANGLLVFTKHNTGTLARDLFGVLVNRNGTIQAPGAFPIVVDDNERANPVVSYDGSNYFVAWLQMPLYSALGHDIFISRVTTSGMLMDPAPIRITSGNKKSFLSIAFDGTNHLIVWLDRRNDVNDVYGARLSRTGSLLDGTAAAAGFPISSGGTLLRYSPYVAFMGDEYLVTWAYIGPTLSTSPLGIEAARVKLDGTLPAGANVAITVSAPPAAGNPSVILFPAIAAGTQQAAVVWLDNSLTAGTTKSLQGATVHPF